MKFFVWWKQSREKIPLNSNIMGGVEWMNLQYPLPCSGEELRLGAAEEESRDKGDCAGVCSSCLFWVVLQACCFWVKFVLEEFRCRLKVNRQAF